MAGPLSNILIDRSVPEHIVDNYPVFVEFLQAYYEYLEQSGFAHDTIKNLKDFRTIDKTLDEYIDYFFHEFLVDIPLDIISDKRILVEHIRKFYLNKGNENSFKFLFRILYNEDVELYYPKIDILRASDGKWYEQKSLYLLYDEDIFPYLITATIEGNTSGAKALVENCISYDNRGVTVIELILSNIKGDFLNSEYITISYYDNDSELQTDVKQLLLIFDDVYITNRGGKYKIDDIFKIKNSENVEVGYGKVTKTSKGPVTGLVIDSPGTGYSGTEQQITIVEGLHFDDMWNGQLVDDYDGVVDDSNDVDVWSLTYDTVIDVVTRPGVGDTIIIEDEPTSSGFGGVGVVSVVGNYGEILEVLLLSGGDLYKVPTAEVVSTTGTGGVISTLGGGGGVDDVKIIKFPIVLNTDTLEEYYTSIYSIYPDFTDKGDGSATGTMLIGTLAEYPGLYINDDSHLSSSKKLQDNYYYQDYSYVIKVKKDINKWSEIIKRAIHPAGLKLFGEYFDVSTVDTDISITYDKTTEVVSISPSEVSIGNSIIKLYSIDGDELIPVTDSSGNWLIDY